MLSTALKQEKPFLQPELLPHQVKMVDHIKRVNGCACFVEMGLGKTLATLTALQQLKDAGEIKRTLVIAPLRVAQSTWPDEIEKWGHVNLTYSVVCGSANDRIKALTANADVFVINRENVKWLVSVLKKWPFDCVVIDESTSFKSSATARFKALKKARHLMKRVILLTGTPAPNGLLDLWAQMYLIDGGERLGKTFTQYRQRYFYPDYMGYNWTPAENAEERIYKKISDVCLTMQAADYITLPARIDNVVPVALPKKALERYRELEREYLLTVDGEDITAINAAALSNKLLQIANGAAYIDEGDYVELHDAKLDALAEIIESNEGKPVLVGYNYRADVERIMERFPKARKLDKDPDTIKRWNQGEIEILLAHPASAGHGLNLQSGGSIAVWFGLTWSLELYQQFNARLHRQGQTKPVIIHHLTATGTIDETVTEAIRNKTNTQQALIDYLKAKLL